jgi:hypothetical protein
VSGGVGGGGAGGVSRRRLLAGAGLAGVTVAVAACGGGGGSGGGSGGGGGGGGRGGAAPPVPTTGAGATSPPTTTLTDDLALARLAGGLEQMAIDLYDAAAAATAGDRLGAVPLAVATYLSTARAQHTEHLAQWNRVLQAGGQPPVAAADEGLKPTLGKMLSDAKDLNTTVGVVGVVEEILADTYLRSIPTLDGKDTIKTAGQILIVDQQHRAILNYLLGTFPVPEPFQVPDKAAS